MRIDSVRIKNSTKWLGIILFLFFCFPKNNTAQTILFKKDRTQIIAVEIDTLNNTFKYKLAKDNAAITHYISKNAIDSIQFENGKTKHFFHEEIVFENEELANKLRRNFIGFNIWPLFQGKINGFYERFIYKNIIGFKNQFQYNMYNFYDLPEDKFVDYSLITGFNFYFFNSAFLRAGTGLSYYHEKFERYDYENFIYTNEYDRPNIVKDYKKTIYINGSFSAIAKEKFYFSIVLDVPIKFTENYKTVYIKTEIAFNF